MQIRPVEVEFHADGRTDGHDELIVAFPNFANAPKKEIRLQHTYNRPPHCYRICTSNTSESMYFERVVHLGSMLSCG